MSANTRIVPSKDALRALRSLAFSPQAAFVGAVGSACGLVAIHHHQGRKIRLAEKIIETKRTIHILSQGRGNAQANRMFEAAEKGEDFTLHHGRPRRSQRVGRYSTNAAAKPVQEELAFKPWTQLDDYVESTRSYESTSLRPTPPARSRGDNNDRVKQYSANVVKSGQAAITPRAKELQRVSQIDQEMAITQTLWRAKKHEQTVRGHWSETVAAAKTRLEARWSHAVKAEPTTTQILNHESLVSVQAPTDLNPVPVTPVTSFENFAADVSAGLSAEESIFFNFVFGKPTPDSIFETNIFQSLQPWEAEAIPEKVPLIESLAEDTTVRKEIPLEARIVEDRASQEPSAPFNLVSAVKSKGSYTSRNKHKQYLEDAGGVDYYVNAFNTIESTFTTQGSGAALASLETTFNNHFATYPASTHRSGLNFVFALLLDVSKFLSYDLVGPLVQRIVREQLSREDPDLSIVKLLYPGFGSAQKTYSGEGYYITVRKYLQDYCQMVLDLDEQVLELYRILDGTVQAKIAVIEPLIVPILRSLTRAGQVKRAHELHDALVSKYNIQSTFYSMTEIMRGYAVAGEWPKVRAFMEKAHSENLSWKKVYGYSALFGGTVEQYASTYPPEKVYKFIETCISEYGLLPTSTVSSRLLRVCLRTRRYDLVRDWISKVQREYPFLSTGLRSQPFAAEAGSLWREMNASCNDVLAGVRALSVNAMQDPFAKPFRGVVSEAVHRDLLVRIKALEKHTTYRLPEYRTVDDVHALLEDVKELVTHVFKSGFTSRTRLLADDLIQQTKAVVEIDELFSGNYEVQKQLAWDEQYSVNGKPTLTTPSAIPHPLRVARLPHIKSLISIVEKTYSTKSSSQGTDPHKILRYTITRLEKQSRHSDAYTLLSAVHSSPYANATTGGHPYDSDLFTIWLKLAITIMTASKYRAVLWNIIDSGPELKITTELVLTARIGVHKTHDSRFRRGNDQGIAEAEYLRARLRSRRFMQRDTHLKWSRWKGLHDNSMERFQKMQMHEEEAGDV